MQKGCGIDAIVSIYKGLTDGSENLFAIFNVIEFKKRFR